MSNGGAAVAFPGVAMSASKMQDATAIHREIICFSGRNPLDEVAAATLAQLLRGQGIAAATRSFHELTAVDGKSHERPARPLTNCVSSLSLESSPANLRFLIRRLQKSLPEATFIACFWNLKDIGGAGSVGSQTAGADDFAISLRQAIALCQNKEREIRPAA